MFNVDVYSEKECNKIITYFKVSNFWGLLGWRLHVRQNYSDAFLSVMKKDHFIFYLRSQFSEGQRLSFKEIPKYPNAMTLVRNVWNSDSDIIAGPTFSVLCIHDAQSKFI